MKHVRARAEKMAEREEEFFHGAPPPSNLSRVRDEVAAFVRRQRSRGRKVVFITVSHINHLPSFSILCRLPLFLSFFQSGGTSVPLEKNTVRFLDNFSSGGRGSSSAEYPEKQVHN